jgi:DNA-directed RNA polymerase
MTNEHVSFQREGMIFAAVHDSYWTHAATVDEMSTVIRDSFIHLHSSNVLENLLKEVSKSCLSR